jgi:hypothetical protein
MSVIYVFTIGQNLSNQPQYTPMLKEKGRLKGDLNKSF